MASAIARRKAYQLCLTPRLRETAIRGAVLQMLRCGITTANAMEGGAFFSDADIEAVQAAARGSVPELLVYPQLMDVDKVLQLGLSRIGGNIYLDGTIGSRTAAVRDNYLQTGHNGLLYYTQEDVDQFVRRAHQCGLQISISCVGERAIEQALHAYQRVLGASGENPLRHRLELFVLPTQAQIHRAVEMGLLLSIRPNYDRLWGGEQGMYARHIGRDYVRANPLGSLLRQGGRVLLGSESGVTPLPPMAGIQSCVTHHVPAERITALEALKMYTVNGAYANFLEQTAGKIAPGYQADLAVLSGDPLTTPAEELERIQVLQTYKRGQLVYDRGGT